MSGENEWKPLEQINDNAISIRYYFLCTTPDPDIIWILVDAIFYRITYITMYSLSNETEMII